MRDEKKTGREPETYMTTSEAADLLNVHPNTVRRWSRAGLLAAYRIGHRRDRRFKRTAIERLARTKS